MITRNGIVYDLSKSPYIVVIEDRQYFFSSENHMKKFNELLQENRDILNYSLSKRFKIGVVYNTLCDLILYMKTESRGFRVIEGGIKICKDNLILNGLKISNRN